MITIESVLSKKNIKQALNKLKLKDDEFEANNENWLNNQERITASIINGTYEQTYISKAKCLCRMASKRN